VTPATRTLVGMTVTTAPPVLHLAEVDAVRGRPTGRGRPSGDVHAVPRTDRTRTALCGERVGGAARPWGGERPGTCPECRSLLAVPEARRSA